MILIINLINCVCKEEQNTKGQPKSRCATLNLAESILRKPLQRLVKRGRCRKIKRKDDLYYYLKTKYEDKKTERCHCTNSSISFYIYCDWFVDAIRDTNGGFTDTISKTRKE